MSVAVNVADSDPAGTVTDDGRASSEVLPESKRDHGRRGRRAAHRYACPSSVWPFQPEAGKVTRKRAVVVQDGDRTRATDPILHGGGDGDLHRELLDHVIVDAASR